MTTIETGDAAATPSGPNGPGDVAVVQGSGIELSFGAVAALRGVDVRVTPGESVAVMGPSGSGKSTLLHCLAGILVPDRGRVLTAGADLTAASDAQRCGIRLSRMGFVFQYGNLIPELTLIENIALPLELLGRRRREATRTAEDWVDRLGIADVADRRPGAVSGGQAQRAAVARALVHGPAVVFADEPTGSLDTTAGEQVLDLLLTAVADHDAALVLVTHDHRVAAHAQRLIVLRDGRVSAQDAP